MLLTLVGIVVAGLSDWRAGVRIVSAALGIAAVLRLALPEKDAGMLAVRHRLFDVCTLLLFGVSLFVLAGAIPDQPV
ncbi:DUF3017 domain-containing protein [Nocardioides faecalis]|uniref:DUF3017 domain-containing protein n=1 Tax=Nocardioides faecalis TaxID=2803858 RepID=UPI0023DD56E0|nr:DUF3017 domain-containing protein [Nocardioides faecalis]